MARAQAQDVLRASLLDRLTGSHGSRRLAGSFGLREIKEEVTRDLQWLLNAHQWWPTDLGSLEEASRSLLTYGIPDLSTFSWVSGADAEEISRLIANAVKTFEPRLLRRSVRVTVVPSESVDDFRVRLRIDAMLNVEPYSEPVSFDTEIDAETGAIQVKGAT